MMVTRRLSGWESYADAPQQFIKDVLRVPLGPKSRKLLTKHRDSQRLGIVWRTSDKEDMAVLPICLMIWRALTQRRHSVIVGGRRSAALAWIGHAQHQVMKGACSEVKRDLHIVRKDGQVLGLRTSHGAWVMRYDGPMHDDYWAAMDATQGADVLLGDFDWISRDIIDEALEDAQEGDHLALLIVNGDD